MQTILIKMCYWIYILRLTFVNTRNFFGESVSSENEFFFTDKVNEKNSLAISSRELTDLGSLVPMKNAFITPVYIKETKTSKKNYRPIIHLDNLAILIRGDQRQIQPPNPCFS